MKDIKDNNRKPLGNQAARTAGKTENKPGTANKGKPVQGKSGK